MINIFIWRFIKPDIFLICIDISSIFKLDEEDTGPDAPPPLSKEFLPVPPRPGYRVEAAVVEVEAAHYLLDHGLLGLLPVEGPRFNDNFVIISRVFVLYILDSIYACLFENS